MIVVRIELWSAITSEVSEIGRMYLANDGDGTIERGNYSVAVCRRGSVEPPRELLGGDPNMPQACRVGTVKDYPRLAYNVWRLITRACLATFPEERVQSKGVPPELDTSDPRDTRIAELEAEIAVIWNGLYDVCARAFDTTREDAKRRLLFALYGGKKLAEPRSGS